MTDFIDHIADDLDNLALTVDEYGALLADRGEQGRIAELISAELKRQAENVRAVKDQWPGNVEKSVHNL